MTCECLLERAKKAEQTHQPRAEAERLILEEFGHCLMSIISYAGKAKADRAPINCQVEHRLSPHYVPPQLWGSRMAANAAPRHGPPRVSRPEGKRAVCLVRLGQTRTSWNKQQTLSLFRLQLKDRDHNLFSFFLTAVTCSCGCDGQN